MAIGGEIMKSSQNLTLGQWLVVYDRCNFDEIIGYIEDMSENYVKLRATLPKKIKGAYVVINLRRDNYEPCKLDIGELSEEEKKFLIDVALMFGDKEWFMELTKGVLR